MDVQLGPSLGMPATSRGVMCEGRRVRPEPEISDFLADRRIAIREAPRAEDEFGGRRLMCAPNHAKRLLTRRRAAALT